MTRQDTGSPPSLPRVRRFPRLSLERVEGASSITPVRTPYRQKSLAIEIKATPGRLLTVRLSFSRLARQLALRLAGKQHPQPGMAARARQTGYPPAAKASPPTPKTPAKTLTAFAREPIHASDPGGACPRRPFATTHRMKKGQPQARDYETRQRPQKAEEATINRERNRRHPYLIPAFIQRFPPLKRG